MEHLPPWLRNVPLPPRPTKGGHASDDTPDWLREAAESAPPASSTPPPSRSAVDIDNDTPDWLRELQSEIGATPTGDTNLPVAPAHDTSDNTPDWMRDIAASEPARPASASGATGWLNSLSADDETAEEPEQETPPTTTSRIKMPVGATDWLRSIGQEIDSEEQPGRSSPPSEMIDDKSGVPDWLRDVSPDDIARAAEAEVESQIPEFSPQKAFDPLASNWLTDDPGLTSDASTVGADWVNSGGQAEAGNADIPAWLRDVSDLDSPDDRDPPRDPDSLPDWLRTSDSPEPPAPPADVDVPDWLRGAEAPQPPAPA
ncbi:MAG: hypothetical protein HGA19_20790, partial [Oscillochloris sp.]|nr:hypothetical protein [Oscillochloris sp.]